jgi:hypothetical protein
MHMGVFPQYVSAQRDLFQVTHISKLIRRAAELRGLYIREISFFTIKATSLHNPITLQYKSINYKNEILFTCKPLMIR